MEEVLQNLRDDGIAILENEAHQNFAVFEKIISENTSELSKIGGDTISPSKLNECRMRAFRELNNVEKWETLYFEMAGSILQKILGPDILIQRKLNFSIQMPEDDSSLLGMHTDTLSGQSPFEVVMWTAFTNAHDSNAMYYFDRETSAAIFSEMSTHEKRGLEYLRLKYWEKAKYLNVKKSNVVLFSGTLFHGNIVNKTEQTRMSINCRFKNLFSPNGSGQSSDRGVGIFYKLFSEGVVTQIGREYMSRKISFEI